MWWFTLLSVFWTPVAGYYIGGWTSAAICGMIAVLFLCWASHVTDLERTGMHNMTCDLAVFSAKLRKDQQLASHTIQLMYWPRHMLHDGPFFAEAANTAYGAPLSQEASSSTQHAKLYIDTACTHAGHAGTFSRFTRLLWAHLLLCALVIPALGYLSGGWLDAYIYATYAIFVVCGFYRFEQLRQWNATGT